MPTTPKKNAIILDAPETVNSSHGVGGLYFQIEI
jgi:hypothetical protein